MDWFERSLSFPMSCVLSEPWCLQIRTVLFASRGPPTAVTWTHIVCGAEEYSEISGVDTVRCMPCPIGGDCSGDKVEAKLAGVQGPGNRVVQLGDIVAQKGCVSVRTPF